MYQAKLIEVPDEASLGAVESILRKYSKQREARAVNLNFTGNRLLDLLALEGLTTKPHYGISGLFGPGLAAKDEVGRLLTGRHQEVFLILHYPWGEFPFFLRRATPSMEGSLRIDVDPPSPGWFREGLLSGLMPILGIQQDATGPIPEEGELVVKSLDSSFRSEGLHISFRSGQTNRLDEFLRELIGRLDQPLRVHVMLRGELNAVRELHESGKIVPCGRCCIWHFEYGELLTDESDVELARLDELAAFLTRRLGRQRVLTFKGFTWSWEVGFEPETVNAVIWSVPKRGPGRISVRWFEDDPPPRGAVSALRKEMERFLAARNAVHGG